MTRRRAIRTWLLTGLLLRFTRELLRSCGIEGNVRAEVLALPPGHPYLRLPLHFSIGLEPRLRSFVDTEELNQLNQQAENELQEPGRWGTTFTVIQSWGRRTGSVPRLT